MSERFEQVLARYDLRGQEEERLWKEDRASYLARRDQMLLHVGRDVAEFLLALIVGRRAKHIVELGTSYGYSTLFLAEAARRTGGRLTTFELSEEKQSYARRELTEAGLADHVDWRLGNAVELLPGIEDGVDFVVIDLWKDLYIPCFEALFPKLDDRAVIAADNMLSAPEAIPHAEAYRAHLRTRADVQTVLLPIGQGIELSCVWRTR